MGCDNHHAIKMHIYTTSLYQLVLPVVPYITVYIGNIKPAVVLLAVFFDDILIASTSDAMIAYVTMAFHKHKIKDMGVDEDFLIIRIRQCPGISPLTRSSIFGLC